MGKILLVPRADAMMAAFSKRGVHHAIHPTRFDLVRRWPTPAAARNATRECVEALETIVNRASCRASRSSTRRLIAIQWTPGAPQGTGGHRHYLTLLTKAFPERRVENVMLLVLRAIS